MGWRTMKGFILGCSHSGTTWAAEALHLSTDLVAWHESMKKELGKGFHGVESNGNFWHRAGEIAERWPQAAIVHLVRDGQKVVRTLMVKHSPSFFEQACRRWTSRNEKMYVDICPNMRYRLEDLTTDFKVFRSFATRLGATHVNRGRWERIRTVLVNGTLAEAKARFPAYEGWTEEQRTMFWRICGEMMVMCRYGGRKDG